MKLHLEIIDDNGEIVAEHFADASTPSAWTVGSGQKPLVSKMPQNSDNQNNGFYELYRITLQPVVRVQRPNGWQEPPPSPSNGPKQAVPWGQLTPTSLLFQTPQTNSAGKPPAYIRG